MDDFVCYMLIKKQQYYTSSCTSKLIIAETILQVKKDLNMPRITRLKLRRRTGMDNSNSNFKNPKCCFSLSLFPLTETIKRYNEHF